MSKKEGAAPAANADDAGVGGGAQQSSDAKQPAATGSGASGGVRYSRPVLVGEPVQFLPGGAQTTYVPATVTKVLENGNCDLHVLRPEFNSTDWPLDVKRGKQRGEFRTLDDAFDDARDRQA
jgi:hypothetical protein